MPILALHVYHEEDTDVHFASLNVILENVILFPQLEAKSMARGTKAEVVEKLNQHKLNSNPKHNSASGKAIIDASAASPSLAVFALPFPKVSNEVIELEEPFSQDDSNVLVAPISLGDDDIGCITRFTPAKRKQDSGFLLCQVGSSIFQSAAVLEGGDSVKKLSGLVAVKIEKE